MTQTTFGQLLQQFGGDEPVPNGEYDVEIIHSEVRQTKDGKPMVAVRCRILHGPYANKVLSNNFTLTEDSSGAMYFWFRNFAGLGLDNQYWASLQGTVVQALPQVAHDVMGRQSHVTVSTEKGRQNVDSWTPISGGAMSAAPMPQAPQPGYGMAGMAPTPQYPQVQQPVMPGFPQQPQPVVGPPGMPQAPQPQPQAYPQPQMPPQMPAAPQMAAPPQPAQPMVAPPPVGAMPPQPQAPQAPQPAPSPQPAAYMEQPLPAPPGFPQAQDPNAGQVAPVTPMPGVVDPNQGQAPAQPFPVPGNPPPQVPV